jgi:dihydrofolate synthase/folylpolyglutamate synthase
LHAATQLKTSAQMNYDAAVRYLLSLGRELAAPTQAAAAKFNLKNMQILAERLDHPERSYPSAHIAGTNGKGSTAAFLESILRQAGFRTGLNTSPHLEKINERIRVNGVDISDDEFAAALTDISELIEGLLAEGKLQAHPTYFECVTAMAFAFFAVERVEFGIFEVGLGGRLDATNILAPVVTIITRIAFDHENFLGHSLEEIAAEKAGILKSGVPLVLAAQQSPEAHRVILDRAGQLHCPVVDTAAEYRVARLSTAGSLVAQVTEVSSGWSAEIAPRLRGRFQVHNAVNALAAARLLAASGLRIPDNAIITGIAAATWPGRIEKVASEPAVYLDGAHNPSAARELAAFLRENFAGKNIRLIFGAMRDKAVDEIAGILFPLATEVIFTEPRNPRAVSASQLAEIAAHHAASSVVIDDAEKALDYALAHSAPNDAIFITGSLYLVGQLRHHWKNRVQMPDCD